MTTERRVATLVQISDLHIGDLDKDGNAAAQRWHFRKLFRGYLGHHSPALDHLDEFFAGIVQAEPDAMLLVSGDLTAFGRPSQFALVQSFIDGEVSLGEGNSIGLRQPKAPRIPGNHDHWPGVPPLKPLDLVMFGQPTASFHASFPQTPFPPIRYSLTSSETLVLAGIDTDADVDPRSLERFFAVGSFKSQLPLLNTLFGAPNPSEIRVLLLHHSPQHPGPSNHIEHSSFWSLLRSINECEISALLTGHLHEPRGEINEGQGHGLTWPVLEARCGTTTVRDEIPSAYSKNAKDRALRPNTLLVHRMYEIQDKLSRMIKWRTSVFRRDPTRGFKDNGPLLFASIYGPRPEVVVWPRR